MSGVTTTRPAACAALTLAGTLAGALAWPSLGRAQPAPPPLAPAKADEPAPPASADPAPLAPAEPAPLATADVVEPAAAPVRSHIWNGFYVRLGGALVQPISRSKSLQLADVNGPATLALHDGPIAGSGAKVDNAAIPAGIIGYTLPTASQRWSLELVFGTPFTVKFEATGTLADKSIAPTALGIPTGVGPLGRDLGEATAVPIVVTTVYQLLGSGALRPYAGAGASVLFAQNAKVTNPTLTMIGHPDLQISPAPGLVLQGGLDATLWRSHDAQHWWSTIYARLDVKFIALRDHAEVHNIEVQTPGIPLFGSVDVGTAKMDVWVNPLIVLAGIGVDL